MGTVPGYVTAMRDAGVAIGRKRGVDFAQADKQTRVLALTLITLLAVVVRALFVAGAVTDAQLRAALDAAMADLYDDEPIEPPPPTSAPR